MQSPTSLTCRPLRYFGAAALHNRALRIIGKNGQQGGHGSTGRRGQIQRFGQRDETDAEMVQFL
jgi:hypothetical protein